MKRYRLNDEGAIGPLTMRELFQSANWWLLVCIIGCVAFWSWIIYELSQWWPA